MINRIKDEQFNNALVRGEIDEEIFYNLSEQQKDILSKYDSTTYYRLNKNSIGKDITIEDFENFSMAQASLLIKINPTKYNELQAQHEELQSNRNKLYNNRLKYATMLRRKGVGDNLSAIVECEKDPEVVKYYNQFNSAVEKVLNLDHLQLKRMNKEQFKKEIMLTFKNEIPVYRW